MVPWATDINTEPDCSRTMGPDVALGSSPGLGVTMTPSDSSDLSDQHGPGGGIALEHQNVHRTLDIPVASAVVEPQTQMWSPAVAWTQMSL